MVRLQIRLTDDQALKLKQAALERGISMAEVVRKATDIWLSANVPVSEVEQRRRAIMAVAGKFDSGLSDVSERHDYYLAEAYLYAHDEDSSDLPAS